MHNNVLLLLYVTCIKKKQGLPLNSWYNVLTVFMLYCKTLLLLWGDMGNIRDRFHDMVRFKVVIQAS